MDIEALRTICGVTEQQAERLAKCTGGVLEDSCFLHWCLTGKEPELYPAFYGQELRLSPGFHVEIGQPEPYQAVSPQEVTQWRDVPWSLIQSSSGSEPEQCVICMCAFEATEEGEVVCLGRCKAHYFHKACISQAFGSSSSVKCPVCGTCYGEQVGAMPAGVMGVNYERALQCDGFNYGTWIIYYFFPDGLKDNMPYKGTTREAFVPNTVEGREVLRLLICAFYRRVSFAVGTSVTTGASNTVVWSGIHHKTSPDGGPTNFGYPDEGYFARVKGELAARGVAYNPV